MAVVVVVGITTFGCDAKKISCVQNVSKFFGYITNSLHPIEKKAAQQI